MGWMEGRFEDSFLITRGLLSQVQTCAFHLEWVNTYQLGLEALRRGGFDACLLDYQLGAHDGVELLREAIADGCRVPIVMFTGRSDMDIDLLAMQVGAADFLVKSALDTSRLERSIRYAVERQRLLDALAKQAEDLRISGAELERYRQQQVHLLSRTLGDRLAELEAILDIVPVCIWIAHDPQCKRITGNRFANELMKVPKGTNVSQFAPAGDRLAFKISRDGKEIPAEKLPLHYAAAHGILVPQTEFDLDLGDGRVVNLVGSAVPLFAEDGQVRGAISAAWDITSVKHAEEEKRLLEAKIQHAQKLESLGVLAGGVAHDFNNLLTGILGYADLALRELTPTSPIRYYVDQLATGARRAADLTKQMLAYSGKSRFVFQPLNLTDVVKEMTHLLQVAITEKCVLKTDLELDLPAIEGDAAQIRQTIMNLVLNASEALGDRNGVIAIRTRLMNCTRAYLSATIFDSHLPEGPYVILVVSDTGCGMTKETMFRIFDPFFTTKTIGRGLGLAAVLGIIRSHHGMIRIDSQPGRGTTFTILFPPSKSQPIAAASPRAESQVPAATGTILIIDDEESVRDLAKRMAQKIGFTVLLAATGREGVEVFNAHAAQVSLVLLDLTMPHMNGIETLRELRRIRSDVRVVLSSGYNEESATNQHGAEGLAGFLQKPYKFEVLENTLRKAILRIPGQ